MKKISAICAVILAVSIIITAFSACGGKTTKDDTTAPVNVNVTATIDDVVFSAEVGGESAVIKNGDEVFQTLAYPKNSGYIVDSDYASGHYEFIDMNFDGQVDFYVAIGTDGTNVYYFCWLYNATTKKFDYSVSLSGLTNISVDSENQKILSTVYRVDSTVIVSYHWVNGNLEYESEYTTENGTFPAEITEAAKKNEIGVDKTPETPKSTEKAEKTTIGSAVNVTKSENTEKTTKSSKTDATEKTTSSEKTTASEKTTVSEKTTASEKTTSKPTTTESKKPLNTTTTAPATGNNVQVNTDANIDDDWF